MYYDFGPGTERGDAGPDDLDCGRYLEFWNLVFPQYDRQGKNDLKPLGRRNVDTGAGFERMLAVIEGQERALPHGRDVPDRRGGRRRPAHEVRRRGRHRRPRAPRRRPRRAPRPCASPTASSPRNEGRGYVLRRILRRAIRDGIGAFRIQEPFLHEIVPSVIATMKDGYPDLVGGLRGRAGGRARRGGAVPRDLREGHPLLRGGAPDASRPRAACPARSRSSSTTRTGSRSTCSRRSPRRSTA